CRHQAGSLRDHPRRDSQGTDFYLVFHRDGRSAPVRPRLCFPRACHHGGTRRRRCQRDQHHRCLLRGSGGMKLRLTSDAMRLLIPALSMTVLLAAVFWLQPRAMSYFGLNLLLNLAVPIALATIAQMLVMAVNDLDLSIGAFVSFVACVTATFL